MGRRGRDAASSSRSSAPSPLPPIVLDGEGRPALLGGSVGRSKIVGCISRSVHAAVAVSRWKDQAAGLESEARGFLPDPPRHRCGGPQI